MTVVPDADLERWLTLRGPNLTAAQVVRCRCCHRPVPTGRTWDGYGERCARDRGLIPPPVPRIPQPGHARQDGPDLLDLLAAMMHGSPHE